PRESCPTASAARSGPATTALGCAHAAFRALKGSRSRPTGVCDSYGELAARGGELRDDVPGDAVDYERVVSDQLPGVVAAHNENAAAAARLVGSGGHERALCGQITQPREVALELRLGRSTGKGADTYSHHGMITTPSS